MCSSPQYILLMLTTFLFGNVHCSSCPTQLAYYKQRVDSMFGVTLTVCCNVERYYLARLNEKSKWRLESAVRNFAYVSDSPTVSISTCGPNNQSFLGYAESHNGVPCKQHNGLQLRLRGGTEGALEMDKWYVQCFQLSHPVGCQVCSLNLFCQNIYSKKCARLWIQKSLNIVTNETMNFWVQVGSDVPFPADLRVEVFATRRQRFSLLARDEPSGSTDESAYENYDDTTLRTFAVPRTLQKHRRSPSPLHTQTFIGGNDDNVNFDDKKLYIGLTGLKPDSWYRVRTCLLVRPPSQFRPVNGAEKLPVSMSNEMEVCSQDESYRTLGGMTSSTTSQCLRLWSGLQPCVVVIFTVYMLFK